MDTEGTPLLGEQSSRSFDFRTIIKRKLPVINWLPNYTLGYFFQDLLAGFTVGLTEIPQGIAYALVAGLPSHYGLYSGFMGCFVYFILGSCKDLNIGPTAIMALMIQPYVTTMGAAAAVLICFLSGCIILLFGLLHLGFIIEFFSYPVIAGFTTAAALNIASSQLKSLLGIPGKSNVFLEAWISVFEHISETRKWDTILGVLTIIFLLFTKEIRRYGTLAYRPEWSRRRNILGRFVFLFSLARNAIAVVIGTTLAFTFYQHGDSPFILTGNVTGGLPSFTPPPFSIDYNGTYFSFGDIISDFGSVVIFCPLIAIVEHIAIAKAFSKGRTLDATQELLALGACNILSSFVQSMPVTASFTRSAVNNASGVKTPAAGIITAIMVLLGLGFLTSAFQYIPKATLAAVIIVAMYYLCEFHAFVVLWKTKKTDLIPLCVTLICSLLINLEYGILIGIATNVLFVLYSSARPKIVIEQPAGGIYLVKIKNGLHFSAAEYVREEILEKCLTEKSVVVIDGHYIGNIDATVAKSFNVLKEELELRDQKLVFLGFKDSVRDTCMGVNPDLCQHFRDTLDQILEVPLSIRSENSPTYTVQ